MSWVAYALGCSLHGVSLCMGFLFAWGLSFHGVSLCIGWLLASDGSFFFVNASPAWWGCGLATFFLSYQMLSSSLGVGFINWVIARMGLLLGDAIDGAFVDA